MNKFIKNIILTIICAFGFLSIALFITNNIVLSNELHEFSDIEFEDYSCTYDGNVHSLNIVGDLPDDAIITYKNNNQINAGVYKVESSIKCYGYKQLDLVAYLTIEKKELKDIYFDDQSFVYDGKIKRIEVTGELPNGVIVHYSNNENFNAGIYDVTANIIDTTGNYLVPSNLTAKLEINKATVDMSDVKFEDKTFTYDGEIHELNIKGELPTCVKVNYENNKAINAGEYVSNANFAYDNNHTGIESLTANLIINKAHFNGVEFNDLRTVYDGTPKSISIAQNLPRGLIVEYSDNNKIEAGEYKIIAHIIDLYDNYYPIHDITANLIIDKAIVDYDSIIFNDGIYTYDGTEHELVITSKLPEGIINVEYENNKMINVGYSIAHAIFTYDSNHTGEIDKTATLIINKKSLNIEFSDASFIYDGNSHSVYISNELPEGVTVTYENNNQVDANVYCVIAKINDSTNNYEVPSYLTANLIINKATYDTSNLFFDDYSCDYDGLIHYLSVEGDLAEDVNISFENNGQVNAGIYQVIAKFNYDELNYNPIPNMVATLTINKKEIKAENLQFLNKQVVYNGDEQVLEITGHLPEGILDVIYENNKLTNVGSTNATVKIIYNNNYYGPIQLNAKLEVIAANFDMSGIQFDDQEVTYDGQPHSIEIIGELPSGVYVTYQNNGQINEGTYKIIAIFKHDNPNYNSIPSMSAKLTII